MTLGFGPVYEQARHPLETTANSVQQKKSIGIKYNGYTHINYSKSDPYCVFFGTCICWIPIFMDFFVKLNIIEFFIINCILQEFTYPWNFDFHQIPKSWCPLILMKPQYKYEWDSGTCLFTTTYKTVNLLILNMNWPMKLTYPQYLDFLPSLWLELGVKPHSFDDVESG